MHKKPADFFKKNYRKEIHIVTTNKCFFNCSHCCGQKDDAFLQIKDIEKIVKFAKENKYNIDWGGGEILSLGKSYLKYITKLFENEKIFNTIYTTLHISLDKEMVDILNKFNRIMISIDSYRLSMPNYNMQKVIENVNKLSICQKVVSYTPSIDDTFDTCKKFYLIATDIGADIFHIGFLYPSKHTNIIPAKKYLDIFDWFYSLESKYKSPSIAYFKPYSLKNNENFGFRAYDCFKNGVYISANRLVSSCAADEFAPSKIKVPYVTLDEFIENPDCYFSLNIDFIRNNFINNLSKKCLDCVYYSFCMGGCPYFRSFSTDDQKVDIYCDVYKKIFELFIERNKE